MNWKYNMVEYFLFCCCDYSVKPAAFDLFLGIAIGAYLAFIYFIVQVCTF